MGRIKLGTYTPLSDAWYEARRWRVGASEAPAVLGMSPWQRADDLMTAKLDGTQVPDSPAMLRGRLLEPAVLAWGVEKVGLHYDEDASAATYVHDEHDWALANPDAITWDGVLVEAKTTHNRDTEDGWGRGGTDQIPLAYQAQVEWACGVIGLDRWVLLVLAGGINGRPSLDFMAYKGRANPARFAAMTARIGRWHTQLLDQRDRTAA